MRRQPGLQDPDRARSPPGGTCAPSSPDASRARGRRRAARRQVARRRRSRPTSTSRPPASQNASSRGASGVARQHQPRPRVRGLEHPVEPAQDRRQPPAPAAQRRGPLVAALGRRASHLPSTWSSTRPGRIPRPGSPRRTARAPGRAAGGRGSGRGRRGTATGSVPSARRRTDARGEAAVGRSGAGRTTSPAARPAPRPGGGRARARSRPRGRRRVAARPRGSGYSMSSRQRM